MNVRGNNLPRPPNSNFY